MRIAASAALYFVIVFGAGMLLGPMRVLWLEPRMGPFVAVPCEAPFVLAAGSGTLGSASSEIGPDPVTLVLMGVGAITLRQLADLVVGSVLRGISPANQLAQFTRPEGQVYAALLIAFAIMPLLLNHEQPPS